MMKDLIARLFGGLLPNSAPANSPAQAGIEPHAPDAVVDAFAPRPPSAAPAGAGRKSNRIVVDVVRRCDSVAGLMAYLVDCDGFVRQAAVRRAAELGMPGLLPGVAARLNDWVAPIRRDAREAVLALLSRLDPATDAGTGFEVLLQVRHLRHARREDHADWIRQFEQRLVDTVGAQRILDAIGSSHPPIAQACFDVALTHRLADTATLCRLALNNKGNIVLARQSVELVHGLPDADRDGVYRQALASRAGEVRAQALRALLGADASAPLVLAESMLSDGNTWVRRVAGNFLTQQGVDVPAAHARRIAAAGSDSRVLRASLAGLAESGGKDHLDLVRAHAAHPLARVQVAAYLAWLHLAPAEKDDIALRVLHSPHGRVRKLFAVFTRKAGAYVPIDIALSSMHAHGDIDQMLALAKSSSWTLLEVVAKLGTDAHGDAVLTQKLRDALGAWALSTVRGYARPAPAQQDFLRQAAVQQTLLALASHGARQELLEEFKGL